MKQVHKQNAGVWLNNNEAKIITNNSGNGNDHYSIQGKLKIRETQASGSEHSMNSSKRSDMAKYFKSLSILLLTYDEIFVFGPGKSQEQFHNQLKNDVQFRNKQITIGSADQLTDNQMIAMVRDFFKSKQ